MKVLAREGVPFTPRGAGTGLSGGALALNHGVVIELARMRKILKIDGANRIAVVQPGVVNSHVSRAVESLGLHYVPDPSSQPTCTIGGNIAESAGGIHCLKYGTTTDHVLGLKVVLSSGEIVDLGGSGPEQPGYDLTGLFIGSEGTFGIATEAILRLAPIPPAVRTLLAEFDEVDDASHAVSAIIAAGVMPAALEMMDHEIIRAVEASVFAAGLSLDIGAALLIELDGLEAGIDDEAERIRAICLKYGARSCRSARDEAERKRLWAARKGAFGAIGRISPDSMIQDAVVPRSRLPEVLGEAYRISAKYRLRLANVFHAGDGNLHPLICFDSRSEDEVKRVKDAGRELMEVCVRAGGSITGEHGVGFDKRELLPLIFSEKDMGTMLRIRAAFDPSGLCNPGKIIPMLRGCGEARAVAGFADPSSAESAVAGVTAFDSASLPVMHQTGVPRKSFDMVTELAALTGEENVWANGFSEVAPESIEQATEVMKLAASEGWTVIPSGQGSWLRSSRPDSSKNLVLSTRKLTRIIEHEPADLIAITQAGVTLRGFNNALGENGQWLPIDPPDAGGSTIGGVVATGLGGPQEIAYGAPRRHVIGMKVVLADGSLNKAGGRVVKNVAGYDLCKLFTGSYGTLGVIVEVNFKLRPVPFETKTIAARGERDALSRAARSVIDSRLFPSAAELVSPKLASQIGVDNPSSDHVLLLKFASSSNAVAEQIQSAAKLVADETGLAVDVRTIDEWAWESLAAAETSLRDAIVWRAAVQASQLENFFQKVDESTRQSSIAWHSSVGNGRLRIFQDAREVPELPHQLSVLRNVAEQMGGSLVIERAPNSLVEEIGAWGNFGNASKLMSAIKQQLDPNGILAPGTFV
jgi:D-lactate dehydrogenase (cytochrome)